MTTASKPNRFWTLITILLVAIIVIGGIVAWFKFSPSQPIEISIPPGQELQGRIYIGGNVTTPGFYPFTTGDSLEALIQAAGGTTSSANLSGLKLYIPGAGEGQEPQKVDINRAEVWLIKALPEIGEELLEEVKARKGHLVSFVFEGQDELANLSDFAFVIPKVKPLLSAPSAFIHFPVASFILLAK